jgi:glycosyltransferase involved in cell wall biosynthesis
MKPGQMLNQSNAGRLRVLFAGHLPPPLGGVATYCESLVNSTLSERVDLAFVQTSTHQRDLSQAGSASYSNILAAIQDGWRFLRAVISHRPQLCHINTAYGSSFFKHSVCLGIARIFGSRVLLHLHCSLSALYSDQPKAWRWFFRQVIRLTSGVITLSSEWQQLTRIVPGSRIFYLQNAIDLVPYQNIARERSHQLTNGTVHVLYLGYIWTEKGSFDLFEAARQLAASGTNAVFNLVGSEMRAGELEELQRQIDAAHLSGTVRLQPAVYGEEKFAYIRDADIFVYPSYSEGMPMAVIEAMASGLPIVASRVGGLPDLVQAGVNGLLVEPGQPEQLATALAQLIDAPALSRSLGEQGALLAARQFDIEQHVVRLVEIYTRCLPCAGESD